MGLTLKKQYRLGIVDQVNYILSTDGYPCAYLNKHSVICLILLFRSESTEAAAHKLAGIYHTDYDTAIDILNQLVKKLEAYLECSDLVNCEEYDEDYLKKVFAATNHHAHPIKKESKPRKIKFYFTDYCNRRCVYCFAGAKQIEGTASREAFTFLTVPRFTEIIREANALQVESIELAGGDPFVIDNIDAYVKVMVEHFQYDWSISTKSYVPMDMVWKLKKAGLKKIQISIDSFRKETVDSMLCSKGAYEEILQTIAHFQEAGIEVITKAVITSLNIAEIPQYFEKAMELGIKEIRATYYYASAGRHSDRLYPTNEQFAELNAQMEPILKLLQERHIYTDYYNHKMSEKVLGDERIYCGGFTSSMSVRYDGRVLFCDSLNHTDDFAVGNLHKQGIMEVWNSKECDNMGDPEYFHERFKGTECYDCSLYHNCFYKRCFVRTKNAYGTYYEKDPACPKRDADYYDRT